MAASSHDHLDPVTSHATQKKKKREGLKTPGLRTCYQSGLEPTNSTRVNENDDGVDDRMYIRLFTAPKRLRILVSLLVLLWDEWHPYDSYSSIMYAFRR